MRKIKKLALLDNKSEASNNHPVALLKLNKVVCKIRKVFVSSNALAEEQPIKNYE